jgi:hypothetical protein
MEEVVKGIQNIQYINQRLDLRLYLRSYNRDVTFLAVYIPTDDSIAHMKEVFYKMLGQQLDQIRY